MAPFLGPTCNTKVKCVPYSLLFLRNHEKFSILQYNLTLLIAFWQCLPISKQLSFNKSQKNANYHTKATQRKFDTLNKFERLNNVTCSASSPAPEVEAEASSFLPPFRGTLRVTTILNDLTVNWQGFFLQNTRKNRWLFSMKLIATVTKSKCPAWIGPKSSSKNWK